MSCFDQGWKSAVGLNFSNVERKWGINRSHPIEIIVSESSKAAKVKILLMRIRSV